MSENATDITNDNIQDNNGNDSLKRHRPSKRIFHLLKTFRIKKAAPIENLSVYLTLSNIGLDLDKTK